MSSDYYGSVAGDITDARRAPGMTADCDGNPLGAGDRVAAWRIGVQYTAVVKKIGDYGDGHNENFRRLTLVREDDGAEVEGFSNLVMVIQPAGAPRSRSAGWNGKPTGGAGLVWACPGVRCGPHGRPATRPWRGTRRCASARR
mgnify:CR=1 FL=1